MEKLDFKKNQTTFLAAIANVEDAPDNASSSLDPEDDLFCEIDKATALKHKEFMKQGLLVSPRRWLDCLDWIFLVPSDHIGCVIEDEVVEVQIDRPSMAGVTVKSKNLTMKTTKIKITHRLPTSITSLTPSSVAHIGCLTHTSPW
ncbi:hypothetical protein SESBI_38575 [Sesbania bispinosa]|nr:hypothetical protein SESBI_38575 [Sesbania bispinosa]